jgi:putative DNA primase/helicase
MVRETKERRRTFSLVDDLGRMATKLDEIGDVSTVIIDPVSAYLGLRLDTHSNAQVRSVLAPLAELAARYDVAIIIVSHLRKANEGDPTSQVTGSGAFVAAVRAAYYVLRDKKDRERRLLLPVKNNLAPDQTGFAYRVIGWRLEISGLEISTSRIEWDPDPVLITIDEALAAGPKGRPRKRESAEVWLREMLANGPLPVTKLKAEAKAAGFSWRTVEHAHDDLRVKATRIGEPGKHGGGEWQWALPAEDAA